MKPWIWSDLHLEFENWLPPLADRIPQADECVCVGDVLNGMANSVEYLVAEVAPHMPVAFVPGNHEYYSDSILEDLDWGCQAAAWHERVDLLDNNPVITSGVRFVGATLWTDYVLDGSADEDIAWSMAIAEGRLNDHSTGGASTGAGRVIHEPLLRQQAVGPHREVQAAAVGARAHARLVGVPSAGRASSPTSRGTMPKTRLRAATRRGDPTGSASGTLPDTLRRG